MEQQRSGSVPGLKQKLAVVGAVAVMSVAGNVATAEAAAPAAAPSGSTVVLAKYNVEFTTDGVSARKARVITCEVRFIGAYGGIPHKSGHVAGTVNVRTGVTCSKPLRMIRGKVGLFSNRGSKIKAFGSTGARTAKGNAALRCKTGKYHGEVSATLYAPAGYTPKVATVRKKTRTVKIRCR